MTSAETAPPGWYPVDVGQERWWDGTTWSAHRRSVVTAAPRLRWEGDPAASLLVGVLCIVPALISAALLLTSLLRGEFTDALLLTAATFAFTSFAFLGIVNHFGLKRQRAQVAAEAYVRAQPPHTP